MSTIYVTDPAESGELPRPGECTLNLAPYVIAPPPLRRPEATGELPIIVDVADRQYHARSIPGYNGPTPGYVGSRRRPELSPPPAGRRRNWPRRALAAIVDAFTWAVDR